MSKLSSKYFRKPLLLASALVFFIYLLFSHSARSIGVNELFVDNTTDNSSLSACTSAPNDCSLRGAILRASQTVDSDGIKFDPSVFAIPQVIILTNGELVLNDNHIFIIGPGASLLTISGNHSSRIFRVPVGISATVELVTLTNGSGVGGGQNGEGGAIYNQGELSLEFCNITNNIGTQGGAVRNSDNAALFLLSSTISDNTGTSPNASGGINNGINSSLTIRNSTISGNFATNDSGANGGGVFNSGTTSILSSTITNNTVTGIGSASGVLRNLGTVAVRNSIIAGGVDNRNFADVVGTFVSNGFNVIGNPGVVVAFNQIGDRTGNSSFPLNPGLYPLQDNGGLTSGLPTHALRPSSPALDQGNSGGITDDQRRRTRPFNVPFITKPAAGDEADIGAVEMQVSAFVNNTANSGPNSLRQVIADAPINGDVVLNLNGSNIINLTGGEIVISKSLNIISPGADLVRVVGTSTSRVFNVGNFAVNISGLTIGGGTVTTEGGGIRNDGNLVLTACNVTNNRANGGGGIANLRTLTLVDSAVVNNKANFDGGGIHSIGNVSTTLINTTVSGNNGGPNSAGGIFNGAQAGQSANLTLINSTITRNSGAQAITNDDFGGATIARTRLNNSIVAENRNTNFAPLGINVSVESLGYNLESDGSSLLTNGINGDTVGTLVSPVNPRLGPLSTNGGSTPNHALLGGSPALDKGNSLFGRGQRGLTRAFNLISVAAAPGGDNSDIGAIEMHALLVTNLNDSGVGSLRSALTVANDNGAGLDDIIFDNALFTPRATINMASGFPDIRTDLSINGPGPQFLTIRRDTGGFYRIFTIFSGMNVNINDLAMSNGFTQGSGGGAIRNGGKLSLSTCFVSSNRTEGKGGAVLSEQGSAFIFDSSTFYGNVANGHGGAIAFESDNDAFLQIINSTISGNRTASLVDDPNSTFAGQGGGIFIASSEGPRVLLEVINSTIVDNTATPGTESTGGIAAFGEEPSATTIILRNSIVALNSSPNFRINGISGAATILSQGYNLTNENASTILNQPTDQVDVNPLIGPLANDGGIQIHALLAGSPALDRGNSFGTTRDQRSAVRPFDIPSISPASGGDDSDIGAYENQISLTAAPTFQFSALEYGANENSGKVEVTITRSGDTSGTAMVGLGTEDLAGAQLCNVVGSAASSRCDYEAVLTRLTFAAGETSKTIPILLVDDSYKESVESFSVVLTGLDAVLGNPAIATISINDNDSVDGPNPIDNASFFVRQHYLDFLNREPDAAGLAFWTSNITSCGADPICIEVKRINVSAAFYLSIEFQNTGYLVERLYKTAYGDGVGISTFPGPHQLPVPIVIFPAFLLDTQQIGKGLVVGSPGWETVLENNKVAFADSFVQRPLFSAALPTTLTPAQFVDQLFLNAGVTPLAPERQAAIDEFAGSGNSANTAARAKALRRVAEHTTLVAQEFNRAFVLMQYFGYLRRGPNELPDSNFSGYDFWLTKLNQFNGNFINAEMVKAFISATEYRQRFGP